MVIENISYCFYRKVKIMKESILSAITALSLSLIIGLLFKIKDSKIVGLLCFIIYFLILLIIGL